MEINVEKAFSAALFNFLKKKYRKITQAKIADKLNVSQQYISLLKKGKRGGTEEIRRAIAEIYGYKYENFLAFGSDLLFFNETELQFHYPIPTEPVGEQKPILKLVTPEPTHEDVIKRFKDKETAKLLNSMLADIEELSPGDYETVKTVIKSIHDRNIKKKPQTTPETGRK